MPSLRTTLFAVSLAAATAAAPAAAQQPVPYDVILAFDGQPIDKSTQLQWFASMAGVGRTVSVRVSRAGKEFDIKVTLGQLADVVPGTPPRGAPRRGHGAPPTDDDDH